MKLEEAREIYVKNPERLLVESCPSADSIASFIKRYAKKGVVGLSGGVDSSLVAVLAVKALGRDNVLGYMMPAGNAREDMDYARMHAEKLGIEYRAVHLAGAVKECSLSSGLFDDNINAGNLKARLRMACLYGAARKYQGVVLGTGNKSELMVGYFTKYGDGGVDILPLGQLYKTQVWRLAQEVGVPEEIVKRVPTAGLWPGQTDEGELGIKYADLDKILLGHELHFDIRRIAEINSLPEEIVEKIFARVAANRHKLELPPMPEPKFEGYKIRAPGPVLTVDAIVRYNDDFVLVKRGYEPYKGVLAFPGGHVEYGQTCEEAVVREVKEETGLEFKILGLLGVYSDPHRDPRGHYVTNVFFGEGKGKLEAGDDAKEVVLASKPDVKNLAFDHDKIWRDYLRWADN
jgi:NAD+ synthase